MHDWDNTVIHAIDFEGSGTSGVVEYGVVTLVNKGIDSVITRLCAPVNSIPSSEYRIHKIKENVAKNYSIFSDDFVVFKNLRKMGIFAAHNAFSENNLIKNSWVSPGKTTDFFSKDEFSIDWGPWIDTLFIYQNLFPNLSNYKLMGLINHFQLLEILNFFAEKYCPVDRKKAHCALFDALAVVVLIVHILSLPECEHFSLEHLIFLSLPNNRFKWHEFFQEKLPLF